MSENTPVLPKRPKHIPSLDGLRAGSMLLVLVTHLATVFLGIKLPGAIAVAMFFLLSGFLITSSFRKQFEKTHSLDIRHFILHRLIRILPPMIATMLFATGLTYAGLVGGSVKPLPALAQAFCLGNYWSIYRGETGVPAGVPVFWYMGVQEQFYLVYPFILLFLIRSFSRRTCALLMWFACVVALAWRFVLVYGLDSAAHSFLATDSRFDAILFGCALAMYGNPVLDPVPNLNRNLKRSALAAAAVLWVISFAIRDEGFLHTARHTIQSIVSLCVFYLAIVDADRPLFRILEHPWIKYIGTISFSLYLIHYVAIEVILKTSPTANPFVNIILATLLALLFGLTLHYCVEKPSARLSKRLGG